MRASLAFVLSATAFFVGCSDSPSDPVAEPPAEDAAVETSSPALDASLDTTDTVAEDSAAAVDAPPSDTFDARDTAPANTATADTAPADAARADAPPPDPVEPTAAVSGIPKPLAGVYTDLGEAGTEQAFRALIAFPIRDGAALSTTLDALYDPTSPSFRKYLSAATWNERHAPLVVDVEKVKSYLAEKGLAVPRVAANRLLIEITGTAGQFAAAFGVKLHVFSRKSPQAGNPDHEVYGTVDALTVPQYVATRISSIVSADRAADGSALPGEAGSVVVQAPADVATALTPANIKRSYGFPAGLDGTGIKLGVVMGATFKLKDLESFWKSFGITRPLPTQVFTMEAPATRYVEGTLDTEWAGALAPGAEVITYQGPDARNTSMIYTFNEAIARGEVTVLTDSFAHREDSEPSAVRRQLDASARMAAALGITVIAASGDSAGTDVPASSPWVTGVGGTVLQLAADGSITSEVAWSESGSGDSLTFARPAWQDGVVSGAMRATCDVAMNAGAGYWTYYLAQWLRYGGTSFGSPAFAAGVAVMNQARAARGLPPIGHLNRTLYQTTAAKNAFRDIVAGGTAAHAAAVGWDHPTGFGAPDFTKLAAAIP